MSFQYDQYLANHRANVKRGFDWLCENLPDVTNDISDAAWQIEFAHDKSKDKEDEYNAYDAYFYGNNRSYKVVQDYQRAWLTHIHRNPHHWQYWILIHDDMENGELETILEMPYDYIVEMICDWWSFSWQSGNLYEIFKWYEEHYNMHTRTVTTTDSKGKTHTRTETYWSWDYAGSEEQRCSEITFLGHIFPSNKVEFPSTEHIDTIKESSHVRHKYYGVDTEYIGTIFTELRDKTISDNSSFYENSTIEETVDYLESDWELWLFWVIWIIVIGLCVFGFYYIDNEWIEN